MKLIHPNDGDCIGRNTVHAISTDNDNYVVGIIQLISRDNDLILWRSFKHMKEKENTMSRDHPFRLKITCKWFGFEFFDFYFESLKLGKRFSDKDKSKATLDFWLFMNGYDFLWQLSILIIYCFITIPLTWILKKIAGIKTMLWSEFKPKAYESKFQKRVAESSLLFSPISRNQILWALHVSENYPILTWLIKRIMLSCGWKGNPEDELLVNKSTSLENIEFIKWKKHGVTQRYPDLSGDKPGIEGNEINARYWVCLRLYDKYIGLPSFLKKELNDFSNAYS